ncbi:MAG: hypothetical protein LC737_11270, partial [Chloroflexi bacterium]|nr:hypothetical protein [Chloroflexota bacterium]
KDTARAETTFFTAFHDPATRYGSDQWAAQAHGTYKHLPVRAAVEASMSAPTYFRSLGRFVDGGVGSYNNTCYVAAVEALRYSSDASRTRPYQEGAVSVYSFGTGADTNKQRKTAAQRMSLLEWVKYIINVGMSDANNQQVYVANQELCAKQAAIDLHRYQFYFTEEGHQTIGARKPSALTKYALPELDAVDLFDYLDEVGRKFAHYLDAQHALDPQASASPHVIEVGRPTRVSERYVADVIGELKRAVR